MAEAIQSFEDGPYRFLSNFWPAVVTLDGEVYRTVEHAYQAAKTFDPYHREIVRDMPTPGMAKRAGRRLKAREDWSDIKVAVMHDLLRQKFARGTEHANLLDRTGQVDLIEGNTWGDVFWGVCGGRGYNMLGKLLMDVRASNRIAHRLATYLLAA